MRLSAIRRIPRLKERGDYLFDALRGQVRGLRITARVDPRRAVLASASIPVYFDPIVIGAERYVDGGVREILPTAAFANAGVTELIGINCSTNELPPTDQLASAGLPAVALRSLTEIALEELTAGDVSTARQLLPSAVIIEPLFDVNATIEVVPGLIELSQDYGWLRACDELQPGLVEAERGDARQLSTLITRLRRGSWADENVLAASSRVDEISISRPALQRIRLRAWAVRELLRRRALMGLPANPQAGLWWRRWGRDQQPSGLFGTQSIWSQQSAWTSNGVEGRVGDAVADPDGFAPSIGALFELGNERLHWLVRGAAFWAQAENESTTSREPVVEVARGTVSWLPKVPRGRHLMAETDAPGTVWVVAEGGRYPASAELVAAAGLTGAEVALLPSGGLGQIPVGSSTSWLRRVAVTDNVRTVLSSWGPTPQEAGSVTSSNIGLTNFTGAPVTITQLTFRTDQDTPRGAVITTTGALPVIAPGAMVWVPVRFAPRMAGTITGTVTVGCSDPLTGTFEVELTTGAFSPGPLGRLEVDPASIDAGAVRVGSADGTDLTLRNPGDGVLQLPSIAVVTDDPSAGFAVPAVLPSQLAPGASTTVFVSHAPTAVGVHRASVVVEAVARTGRGNELRSTVEVPLSLTAQAPRVFLPDRPRALPLPGGPVRPRPLPIDGTGPIDRPVPERLVVELQRLDFGAVDPGATALRTFWVRNVGDLPLRVAGVTPVPSSSFGVPDLSCFPRVLAPGDELSVEVIALGSPVPGLPLAGEFWVETDDPLRPRAVLTAAARTSGTRLQVPSERLDLGVGPGPLTGELVIGSVGTEAIAITKLTVRDDPPFSLAGAPALPHVLNPGETLTLQVTCTGPAGPYHGQLLIDHRTGSQWVELVAELT